MKKKKIILIGVITLLLVITSITLVYLNNDTNNEIYISKELDKEEINSNGFLTMMYETGIQTGEYVESTSTEWLDSNYVFNASLSACENGGELRWDSSTNTVKLFSQGSDRCYVYFDRKVTLAEVCNVGETLESCIKNYYNELGEGYDGLYLHDGIGSYVNSDQEAGDNSYRYSGANPNNYVCFGDDCSDTDNLYRIIGVFDDQVKLIKYDYTTTDLLGTDGAYNNTYYDKYVSEWWTSYYKGSQDLSSIGTYDYDWRNNSNVWSELNLNTTNLNVNYLNNVADTYKNMIYTSTWYVGGTDTGSTGLNYLTVHDWFNAESTGTTWTGKIGLMYISDYGYAASPIYWNLVSLVGGYAPATDNWMYMGLHEWTITRNSNSSRITLFGIHEQGGANDLAAYAGNSVAVRPAFYLKSQVLYAGGDGSKENPIQLSYNPTLADLCEGLTLSECITTQVYTGVDGDNGLYYHDADLANGAGDNSYRYAGANPNNYVCFGSDAATCPSDNLYRVIGVFGDQVKLIMADYPTTSQTGTGGAYYGTYGSGSSYQGSQDLSTVGRYYWNPSGTNTWSSSTLTTTNLNSTFLNSLGATYRNQISDATWYVNGYSTSSVTAATWHDNESTGTTWTGKIGLMYVSDYGFAASNSAWTTDVSSYNSTSIRNNNWMYMGLTEWTISRESSYTNYVYLVNSTGYVTDTSVNNSLNATAVRPCFYLTPDVTYAGGTGTESDPLRVN